MKKKVLIKRGIAIFMFMAVMVVVALPAYAEDVPKAVLDSRNGVVRVVASVQGGFALGSGFCIGTQDEMYIATNFHVINVSDDNSVQPEIRVYYETGKYVKAAVYAQSSAQDLAVLRLEEEIPGAQVLPLQIERISVGMASYALGYPAAADEASGDWEKYVQGLSDFVADKDALSVTGGSIASIRDSSTVGVGDFSGMVKTLQTTAAISGGNSGGPLVDKTGCVVGVNTQVGVDETGSISPGMGFAVHVEELMTFLDASGIYYTISPQDVPEQTSQPEAGRFSTTTLLLIAFIGVVLIEGIVIIVLVVRHQKKNT